MGPGSKCSTNTCSVTEHSFSSLRKDRCRVLTGGLHLGKKEGPKGTCKVMTTTSEASVWERSWGSWGDNGISMLRFYDSFYSTG